MKKIIASIFLSLIVILSCKKDEKTCSTEPKEDCLCKNETEYLWWKQDNIQRKTTSVILDYYDEYISYNFGGYEFYGTISNSEIGLEQIFKLPLKVNYEYDELGEGIVIGVGGDTIKTGVWGGIYPNNPSELDTIFKNLKISTRKGCIINH